MTSEEAALGLGASKAIKDAERARRASLIDEVRGEVGIGATHLSCVPHTGCCCVLVVGQGF